MTAAVALALVIVAVPVIALMLGLLAWAFVMALLGSTECKSIDVMGDGGRRLD